MRSIPLRTVSASLSRPLEASQRGRFRAEALQSQRHHRRHRADDEHPLPAEARHDEGARHARAQEAHRKYQLIGQERSAAPLGAQDLADVCRGDRDLAAQSDAFDEAAPEQLVVAVRHGAGEAHDGVDPDRKPRRRDAPHPLGGEAEEERAHGLAEIGDADEAADAPGRNVPGRNDHRQDIGEREGIEEIEEDRDAENGGDGDVPARERQSFQPRDDGLLVERQHSLHLRPPGAALPCVLRLRPFGAPLRMR